LAPLSANRFALAFCSLSGFAQPAGQRFPALLLAKVAHALTNYSRQVSTVQLLRATPEQGQVVAID